MRCLSLLPKRRSFASVCETRSARVTHRAWNGNVMPKLLAPAMRPFARGVDAVTVRMETGAAHLNLVAGREYLPGNQRETSGYGLYSYVLFADPTHQQHQQPIPHGHQVVSRIGSRHQCAQGIHPARETQHLVSASGLSPRPLSQRQAPSRLNGSWIITTTRAPRVCWPNWREVMRKMCTSFRS